MGLAIIVPSISFDDANLGKVTLSGNVPIRGLCINLNDSYLGTTVNLKCYYLPANTTQRDVVWSIKSGSEYVSISGSVLTILQGASHNDVTIKCTSTSNPTVVAEKTITVTYNAGGETEPIYNIENYAVNGDTSKIITLGYNLLTGLPEWTFVFKATRNNDTVCNYFSMECLKPYLDSFNAGGISCKNNGMVKYTTPEHYTTPKPNYGYAQKDLVQLAVYDCKIALKCSDDILFYSLDGINWVDTNISVSSMDSISGYDTPKLVLGGSRNLTTVQYPLQGSFSAYLFNEALDNVSYLL